MKSVNTNPVAAMLLSKFKPDDEIRDQIEGGQIFKGEAGDRIRFHVVVEAETMKVGHDTTAKVAASIPWKTIAMLALSKLNASARDAAVREALTLKGMPDEIENMVKPEVEALADGLLKSTIAPRRGSVTATGLTFSLVEAGEVINLPVTKTLRVELFAGKE